MSSFNYNHAEDHLADLFSYGKNVIDIQLSNDGLIIQGDTSNAYLESRFGSRPAHTRHEGQRSLEDIEWPEFLRRVQSLRFSIVDSHKSNFTDVRKVSNENILYSLCSFLGNDHKLDTIKIDLRRRDRKGRIVAKTSDLHCLLTLDPLPTLKIDGDGMFDKLAVDSEIDLRTIARLSMARCREFNDACYLFDQAAIHPLTPRDQDLLARFGDSATEAFDMTIEPIIDNVKLSKVIAAARFSGFIELIREAMEQFDIPLRKSLALTTALDKLLRFDIDVKVARHAAKRMAEAMEADE